MSINTTKLFNKSFTIMSVGQFISLFGNSLQRFALSLLILDLTGSAKIFSIIIAVTFVPQILLSPFGGAIADRFSKKWIMVLLDTISCGILFIFFLLFSQTQNISWLAIGILMFVLTIIQSIYDPSVRASIPAVTSQDNLSSANSVVSIISSITGLLGPIAGGFLYGMYGIETILLINTISFLFSAIMELFLVIPFAAKELTENVLATFWSDIKGTCTYLIHEKPIIFKTILISSSINLFLAPIYSVGMPFMEKIIFGVSNELYGISEGFVGAGMIIGAVLAGVVAKKYPFAKMHVYFYTIILLVAVMGICGLPIILGTSGPSYVSYVLFTASGFLFAAILAVVNILCMTYMQMEIPMAHMGKCMALIIAMSNALFPVGQLIFGVLYDTFASATWFIYILVGLCTIVITVIMQSTIRKAFPATTEA